MLRKEIDQQKEEFWLNHRVSPELIILRPEIKMQLIMELFGASDAEEALEFNVNTYDGMDLAVSDDECFPKFKLALY